MRVLVVEQEFGGHYYEYLAHMLPGLADLVDEVVVAITPLGAGSLEYERLLSPLADRVQFRPVLPQGDPGLGLRSRLELLENLKGAVRQVRPDYVLVPSGDGQAFAMGLLRPLGRGGLPGGVPCEVGIHYGYGLKGIGAKNRLKDLLYLQAQRLSDLKRIHYVSLTNFERVVARGGPLADRARLLPHPVPPGPRHGKEESRRRLGLPEEGRYIGLAASLDTRKAIPEFLAAFRQAAGDDDRMLLAGRLHPSFARLVGAEYDDLVRGRRLIILDGFYDQPTLELVLGALDVLCAPYLNFGHLSASMLQGVGAGRPVLVNDFGWMQAMVRRFGFGWVCNIHDRDSFASTIREALDRSPEYRESEATRRLMEFHSPENYSAHWLEGIRETMGLPASPEIIPWHRVVETIRRDREPVG